jgi:hypothetical protein
MVQGVGRRDGRKSMDRKGRYHRLQSLPSILLPTGANMRYIDHVLGIERLRYGGWGRCGVGRPSR